MTPSRRPEDSRSQPRVGEAVAGLPPSTIATSASPIGSSRASGGIRPVPAHPGYRKFVIQPVLAGDLSHVRASTASLYGTIASVWWRDKQRPGIDVQIPPNSSATVFSPTSDLEWLRRKGPLPAGVSLVRSEGNCGVLRTEAGRPFFQVSPRGAADWGGW